MNAVAPHPPLSPAAVQDAVARACRCIAPLWPLPDFVAVNPFLGFTGQDFAAAAMRLRRVAGVRVLMPRAFYRAALARGEIAEADLAAALTDAPPHWTVPPGAEALRHAAAHPPAATAPHGAVATVAQVLDRLAQGDKQASRTAFMIDEISRWCAGHFDAGQAQWPAPGRSLPPYTAWRAAMRHDRNAEAMGIAGFRATVAALPDDPLDAIAAVLAALAIPPAATEDYLLRALLDIGGWAAHARTRSWPDPPDGGSAEPLVHLLAIRVVWGYALFRQRSDAAFRAAWQDAMAQTAAAARDDTPDADLATDLLLHAAYEHGVRRTLLAGLSRPAAPPSRPAVQAVFCIDVRSEVFRRALESLGPAIHTLGFAGFFGVAFDYLRHGETPGTAQAPVLLRPALRLCETVDSPAAAARQRARRSAALWQRLKLSAVSCFGYVEASGLLSAGALARAAAGRSAGSLDIAALAQGNGPDIAPGRLGGQPTGIAPAERIALARSILRGMSLTDGFARLVLLVGHGGNSANNPFAAALDCGACGGHSGDSNARAAAAILNDAAVRAALAADGIAIPADTRFLAALHDTTGDDVHLLDTHALPASHAPDLQAIRRALDQAAALTRRERAPWLGLAADATADRRVRARASDWAQTRPEWGLAGNAAFIAAPRAWTRGLDLQGRAFLHDYDWRGDCGFAVLELIMTAPLVVASWINLQYFAATTNNAAFGSGNKLLHNVCGRIGVLEGNAGDLRPGLPLQSVHDGTRLMHEPHRLSVVIAAPPDAIDAVLHKHASVRDLFANHWLHLFAMPDTATPPLRWFAPHRWKDAV